MAKRRKCKRKSRPRKRGSGRLRDDCLRAIERATPRADRDLTLVSNHLLAVTHNVPIATVKKAMASARRKWATNELRRECRERASRNITRSGVALGLKGWDVGFLAAQYRVNETTVCRIAAEQGVAVIVDQRPRYS